MTEQLKNNVCYVVELEYPNGMWDFKIEEKEPIGYVFAGSYQECIEYTCTWMY